MKKTLMTAVIGRWNAYIAKCHSYSPIGFWPLIQDVKDYSGNGRDGTGTNITFEAGAGVDGRKCAYFDDTAWVDIYSAALAAAWNGNEICIGGWFRQTAAALTDADTHDMPVFYADGTSDNCLFFRSTNGNLSVARSGTANMKTWNSLGAGAFGGAWRHLMFRCTIAGDAIAMYRGGVRNGPYTGSSAWAGTLATTGALWGASSGGGKIHHWLGWMQYVGIYPLLSEAAIADLAVTPV